MYSAAPRTLSLALPSQLFKDDVELNDLLEKTRKDAKYYAELFSNGNENLARGIEWQYEFALKGLEEDNSAPVEINFGTFPVIHSIPPLLMAAHRTRLCWSNQELQ